MSIEANSLDEELRGISRYEKVAYASIFMIGLLIIKTDDAYITCETSNEFQGVILEIGLIPLAFIGDVIKNLNINIFVVGLVQFLVCQLRLQFTMIYLLYRILGQGKMIYSLLYLIPLIGNIILPYQKVLFSFAQFVLVLLIIMLNKTLMQQKQHKPKINLKFYASRLIACSNKRKNQNLKNILQKKINGFVVYFQLLSIKLFTIILYFNSHSQPFQSYIFHKL